MTVAIELQIMQAIAEYLGLGAEDLESSSDLREDLGLGPIELNDLLARLAQKFEISFDSDEVEDLQKVEDLIVLIEDNLLD